ncbi:hypothetical protein TrLO_g8730 [Triparma laevis f. longispina]|uniref:SH3 domain-containing protein n=1 Tax=Triparma laevis f. longispina TaxID=1714387 RepID=A0A9W7A3N5_9STRA|nr:hypothetical protein TrLO_g8730 [Triparma laevis f. longispina]
MSCFATAQFPYKAEEKTELSFEEGDVIEILDACDGDWWYGKIETREGYFPHTYVKAVEDMERISQLERESQMTADLSVSSLKASTPKGADHLATLEEVTATIEEVVMSKPKVEEVVVREQQQEEEEEPKKLKRGDAGWRPPPPRRKSKPPPELTEIAETLKKEKEQKEKEQQQKEVELQEEEVEDDNTTTAPTGMAAYYTLSEENRGSDMQFERDTGDSVLSDSRVSDMTDNDDRPSSDPSTPVLSRLVSSFSDDRSSEASGAPPPDPKKEFAEYEKGLYAVSFLSFATNHFVKSKGGMFHKKEKIEDQIQFSNKPTKHNLLAATDPSSSSAAVSLFHTIMVYMGDAADKKIHPGTYLTLSDICRVASEANLIDEVLVYCLKQTNSNNSNVDSVTKGFEIIAQVLRLPNIAASSPLLLNLLRKSCLRKRRTQSAIGGLACVCFYTLLVPESERLRLERLTVDDLEFARTNCKIPDHPFNCSLEEVLRYEHYTNNPLSRTNPLQLFTLNPWVPEILRGLVECTRCLGAHKTVGIFRLASDKDDIIALKDAIKSHGYAMILDVIRRNEISNNKAAGLSALEALQDEKDVYTGLTFGGSVESGDLLKQWLRGLTDPLIPSAFYNSALESVNFSGDLKATVAIFNNLIKSNQASIAYIVSFLVDLLDHKDVTLMDEAGLAIVFSPNLLKEPTGDPMKFAMNSEKEKRFVINLIEAGKKGYLKIN